MFGAKNIVPAIPFSELGTASQSCWRPEISLADRHRRRVPWGCLAARRATALGEASSKEPSTIGSSESRTVDPPRSAPSTSPPLRQSGSAQSRPQSDPVHTPSASWTKGGSTRVQHRPGPCVRERSMTSSGVPRHDGALGIIASAQLKKCPKTSLFACRSSSLSTTRGRLPGHQPPPPRGAKCPTPPPCATQPFACAHPGPLGMPRPCRCTRPDGSTSCAQRNPTHEREALRGRVIGTVCHIVPRHGMRSGRISSCGKICPRK